MPRLALLAALLLLAVAPARAQTELMQCFAGINMDAFAAKVADFTAERGLQARLRPLCDAGDRDAAAAYAEEVEAEFYAQPDPQVAAMRACLEDAGFFEPDPDFPEPHVCDQEF